MRPTGKKIKLKRIEVNNPGNVRFEEADVWGDDSGWWARVNPWVDISLELLWAGYFGFSDDPVIVNGYEWRYADE